MIVNTRATAGGGQPLEYHDGSPVIGNNRVVVQNLGGGIVYWSRAEAVDPAGPGVELGPDGKAYEFPRDTAGKIYVTSDVDGTDLRVERV